LYDLPRRFLKCRIDPQTEAPHQRHFDFDPVQVVTTYRYHLVSAALTLLRAAFNRGLEPRLGAGRMASFEAWDDLVRQTVCWLSSLQAAGQVPAGTLASGEVYPRLVDPMQAVIEAVQADPARSQQGRLLSAWVAEVGTGNARETTLTARQLEQFRQPMRTTASTGSLADRPETLYEALRSLAGMPGGAINTRSLGKLLSKFKDRVCAGYCLRAGPPRQGVGTWWVEDVGGFGGLLPAHSEQKKSTTLSRRRGNRPTKPTKTTTRSPSRKTRLADSGNARRGPNGDALRDDRRPAKG